MKLPVIVIFDVDGTLIGNVEPLLTFWLSIKDILHYDIVQEKIKSCLTGFIRPGIFELMKALTKKYHHVEFFIYSAGREEWLEVLVPCLEGLLGVSFNRPLFGRSSCIIGYKMIECVALNILRVIKAKYNGRYSIDDIRDMVVIFDDNPTVYDDMRDFVRVIKCPTYRRRINIDVVKEMGEDFCRLHCSRLSKTIFCKELEYEVFVSALRLKDVDIRDENDFFGQFDLDEVDTILFPR